MSTITKEFTKEQLQQIEAAAKEVMWPVVWSEKKAREHFSEKITPKVVLELARIALASLEAEAVADVVAWSSPNEERTCDIRWRRFDLTPGPLYTATPAPVAMKDHQIRELVNELRDIAVEYHGTQQLRERIARTVRAAMLQSFGNSEQLNSPVTPDGWVACSERMPKKGEEVLCTDQFENYETALYDTGYIPGPPFFATTAGEFHPTHWMPLPAAPQQEISHALAKGMERYGDAMQELAKKEEK